MLSEVKQANVGKQPLAVVRFRATAADLGVKIRQALAAGEVYKAVPRGSFGLNTILYCCDGDNLDVQLGVQAIGPFEETEVVTRSATPPGMVARVIHTGPYSALGEAHEAIKQWCSDNGRTTSAWSWETYGHWTEDESKLETEVSYLLE